MQLWFDEVELRLFTTVVTIGAPHDTTLHEFRFESLLPMDRVVARWARTPRD